jgi:hypothetical protein
MYDYISFRFELPAATFEREQSLGHAPAFADAVEEVDKHGRYKVRALYKGLRIEYYPGQHYGYVRGSLHTFAQNSNVGAFTAPAVARACDELATALDLPQEALVVRRMEVGVNLASNDSPREFLATLVSHKASRFAALSPPAGIVRPMEYEACHANYRLKYYDKGAYLARQGQPLRAGCHLLRFEVKFTRAVEIEKLVGRPRLTLADLPDPDVWGIFAAHLIKQWNTTTRRHKMNYSGLDIDDALLLRSANDTDLWEAMKATTPPSTYKRRKRKLKLLCERNEAQEGPHPYDTLIRAQVAALAPVPA